jgi:hypothetical protein
MEIIEKIRRKPDAIIKSYEMDPDKKAIYVEGKTDRLFFEYLFEKELNGNTIFFEIDTVDLPEIKEGGNRERILAFATKMEESSASIKFFIDADFSRIMNEKLPKAIILTDYRDLEAYLYDKNYLTKFIKIGLKTDKITPEFIFDQIHNAREIAILRLCSKKMNLELPFQKTNEKFSKYYVNKNLNLGKYFNALIQNCKIKHEASEIERIFEETLEKYKHIDNRDLLHGKDVLEIIKEIAKELNYNKNNVELIFWMSFDKTDISNYSALKKVGNFLQSSHKS